MIKADEDDDPTWINVGLSERKNLSKSTTMMPDLKKHPKLLDDTQKGLGYNTFQLLDILGQGTFGKVFKVKRKDQP